MNWSQLDFFFPFLVFFYGILVVLVLEVPQFSDVLKGPSRERAQLILQHLEPKRKFGWICLLVGAVWSVQNLVFT